MNQQLNKQSVSKSISTIFKVRITGNSINNDWIAWKNSDLKVESLAEILTSLNTNVKIFDKEILFSLITDRIGKTPDASLSLNGESRWTDIEFKVSTPIEDQLRVAYFIGGESSTGEYKLEKGLVDIKDNLLY